jgi:hypothetical protein
VLPANDPKIFFLRKQNESLKALEFLALKAKAKNERNLKPLHHRCNPFIKMPNTTFKDNYQYFKYDRITRKPTHVVDRENFVREKPELWLARKQNFCYITNK